jgi:FdhD protein
MSPSFSAPLALAEEVPVALVFNGISHAVMMATPADLEDFALGFALTEGLIESPAELFDCEHEVLERGIELRLRVAAQAEHRIKARRRTLAGRTGCGLCGADSLEQVRLPLKMAPPVHVSAQAVTQAHRELRAHQPLNQRTGATHAAAWANPAGDIVCVREDVGRHNALDKLVGALITRQQDMGQGFVCITSRASFEMVQKTLQVGAGVLSAVSAPTALAVALADEHQLLLMGLVRGEHFTTYTHGQRLHTTPTTD